MFSATSPGLNPAANSARPPRQGAAWVASGSKIGPGEVNKRPNEPEGPETKPPNWLVLGVRANCAPPCTWYQTTATVWEMPQGT